MAVSFSCKKGVEDSPFFLPPSSLFTHSMWERGRRSGVPFVPRRRKKVRKISFLFLFVTAAADEFRSERRDDDDEMSNGGGGGESPGPPSGAHAAGLNLISHKSGGGGRREKDEFKFKKKSQVSFLFRVRVCGNRRA